MPSEEIAARRWPRSMKILTKGEYEHRRQQLYMKTGVNPPRRKIRGITL